MIFILKGVVFFGSILFVGLMLGGGFDRFRFRRVLKRQEQQHAVGTFNRYWRR